MKHNIYNKIIVFIVICIICTLCVSGCMADDMPYNNDNEDDSTSSNDAYLIDVELSIVSLTQVYIIRMYNNQSSIEFVSKLPMTIEMQDLNCNEKYYYLPDILSQSAQRVERINIGDFMLYGSDCIVLFYKEFDSEYSYTKLGSITDVSGLSTALGIGNKILKFTIRSKNNGT